MGLSAISKVRFALTASALLRSADILLEQNGQLVVQRAARMGPVCSASPGITFRFGSTYRRGTNGKVESGIECELLEATQMQDVHFVVSLLQNVLVLASFAERRIVMLTGWTISYASGATTTYYRRDFATPSQEETDIDATLISLRDIETFLNRSLPKFGTGSRLGALKQAIYFALHGQAQGIGDAFVMLFAGIETLLNVFEPVKNVEPLVPKKQWQMLADSIAETLERQQGFRKGEGIQYSHVWNRR